MESVASISDEAELKEAEVNLAILHYKARQGDEKAIKRLEEIKKAIVSS